MLSFSISVELGFLYRALRSMGCFFGCFRIKDNQNRRQTHLVSESLPSESRGAVISQNRLSSLFLAEEGEGSPCKDKESHGLGTSQPDVVDRELKDEAKFLKACGTLPETPDEIRKVSEKLKGSLPHDRDSEPTKFHSWLPNTSIKKLHLDKQPDQPPTPIKLCEEWGKGSVSSEYTPISISDAQNTRRVSSSCNEGSIVGSGNKAIKVHADQTDDITTSVSPWLSATNVQPRNKSVRFECESDVALLSSSGSSSENVGRNLKKYESPGNHSVSKHSPYPTPLKLTEEMQTPGTVFPANLENLANGKNARIRSQYVYSVMNPVENSSQWEVLKEEDSNSHQLSGNMRESLEQPQNATPKQEAGMRETSVEKELKVDASLTSWLKPPPSIRDGNNQSFMAISSENLYFGKTPGDRPILGTVAAHWNEDDLSHISPKWWDGNGIPNSTNKYKEDQKVSWHATPFEERLEKALSEESFITQRKDINEKPIRFDENEENDTATSKIQSLTHPKSVVTF